MVLLYVRILLPLCCSHIMRQVRVWYSTMFEKDLKEN
jgi:hypothetical protein